MAASPVSSTYVGGARGVASRAAPGHMRELQLSGSLTWGADYVNASLMHVRDYTNASLTNVWIGGAPGAGAGDGK